ncbi:hypothetical protein C8J57DRAFT_1520238 [Mycena rebaudengoi]|nr:hypothetical protein C8J57DRAFT_1520238 [Mycena rebaudengoi]
MKLSYSKNGEGDVYTLAQTTYFPIHCLFSSGPRATAARLFRRVSALFFASPYDTDAIRFLQLITDATLKFPPTVSDDDLDSIQISLPPTLSVLLASLSRSFPHARPSSSLSSPPSFSRLIPPVLTPFIVQLYRRGVFRVDARLRAIVFIPGALPLNVRRSGPGMTVRTGGTQNCAHVIPLSTASDSAFIYASRVNPDSSSSHPPHDTLSPELDTPPMDFHRRAPRASSPPLRLLRRIEFLHLRVPPTGVSARTSLPPLPRASLAYRKSDPASPHAVCARCSRESAQACRAADPSSPTSTPRARIRKDDQHPRGLSRAAGVVEIGL